jgi:hypothetical protein
MNRRSVRQNVSDKAMNVIGEALCGSKVTIAVVRGDLFTVQVRSNINDDILFYRIK